MLPELSNLIASLSSSAAWGKTPRRTQVEKALGIGWRPGLLALAAAVLFLVTALRHLDGVPQVYEDEPWQASTAYKLETSGIFGSDLFAGFYAMDQRYYGFMPLHPMLLAAFFRAFGLGLLQARLETVSLSLIVLALTFALGTRLWDAWVGATAVVLLVSVRWTGLTYVQVTGIPLVDFARIARYDPMVPVIGLASLHLYLSARGRGLRWWLYAAAGALAGAAGLAHLYGLFWLPILIVLAAWDGRPRAAGWLFLGSVLPWLPYAAYVLADLPDWRGQTLIYQSRFDLLDASWYRDNLLQEYHRYGPGLGPPDLGWLLRVGFWVSLVALPISVIILARRAIFKADAAARAIVVPAILLPALFALSIKLKLVNYTLLELPLFALAIAWGIRALWLSGRTWARPLIATLAVAVVVEGGAQLGRLEQAAQTTTPYPTFIAEVRQYLPSGARVLGLHTYWFGLQDFDYRSFLVPLNLADDGVPLDEALARVAPDIVLVDSRMREYFNSPRVARDRDRFNGWLQGHAGHVIGRVDDPTYGLMEVYQVQR